MATDQRRRQKKLEQRAARRKQRHKELQRKKNRGLAERLALAASSPILHCCTTQALWEDGISNVLISREITSNKVGFAMFLVDMYCLGVKDAFGNVVSRGEYQPMYRKLAGKYRIASLEPADLRKLVEGAVDYARSIGLEPHGEYHKVRTIFGDVDAGKSTSAFEYGYEDGKPHFIAGPNDGAFRCQQIIDTLERTCGPDGYYFTIPFHDDTSDDDDRVLRIDADGDMED
jgi:hypothetical protein